MKELKIEKYLEKTQLGDNMAAIAQIETGGFAVITKNGEHLKVCYKINLREAINLYAYCAVEVIGGQGYAWIN